MMGLLLLGHGLLLIAPSVQAGPIFAGYGATNAVRVYSPIPGNQVMPAAGGTFSLHSGAIAGAVTDFGHFPDPQPAADANFFPTDRVFRRVQSRAGTYFNAFTAMPLTPPVPYATAPKRFDGTVAADRGAQAAAGTTRASAQSNVRFTSFLTPDGRTVYSIDPRGSFVRIQAGNMPGRAGTVMLDPLYYSSVAAGDIVSSTVHLSKSDFNLTVGDPNGWAGEVIEGAANIPGMSPGALGSSVDGNPLLYELSVSATPNDLQVSFEHNQGVGIFMPGTDTLLTDSQVISEIMGDLTLNGDTWALNGDLDLFDARVVLPSDMANLQVETDMGLMAAEAPEPSSVLLLSVGVIALLWKRLF
jgi:hypothetical protein